MHDFTSCYRFDSGTRRKSFDFYGMSRADMFKIEEPPILESPAALYPSNSSSSSSSPSPPSSPEPDSDPDTTLEPAPAMPEVPADVQPGTVHVTFRLPDGARHTGVFQQEGGCSELYRWLTIYAQMDNFNVWTAFPRVLVSDGDVSVQSVVGGGNRAMLIVSEKE